MFEKNQNHAKGKSTRAALTKAVCVRKCMIYHIYHTHSMTNWVWLSKTLHTCIIESLLYKSTYISTIIILKIWKLNKQQNIILKDFVYW